MGTHRPGRWRRQRLRLAAFEPSQQVHHQLRHLSDRRRRMHDGIGIQQSATFARWLRSLRDARARARVVATRPQRLEQPSHHVRQFRRWNMQQAGAGPDAVELVLPVDVLKTQALHWRSQMALSERDESRRGVKGHYPMTALREGQSIAAGPASSVKDLSLIRQQRQEAAEERRHVDFDPVAKESCLLRGTAATKARG